MKYIVKKPFGNVKVGEVLETVGDGGIQYAYGYEIEPHEIALMLDAGFLEASDWKWKPKEGESYWFIETKHTGNFLVSRDNWYTADEDVLRLELGNCFQTKELAEAKLAEIKEVLKK